MAPAPTPARSTRFPPARSGPICWPRAGWARAAGGLTVVTMLHWAVPTMFETLVLAPGVTRGAIPDLPSATELHLVLGLAFAALFGLSGYAAQGRSDNPIPALL